MHTSITILLISRWIALSSTAPTSDEGASKVRNSDRIRELQNTWKGVYFADAAKSCDDAQFEQLVNSLKESMELMHTSFTMYGDISRSQGWNRFFMMDDFLPKGYGWDATYPYEKSKMLETMRKVYNFIENGHPRKWERMKPSPRLTFVCAKKGDTSKFGPRLCTENPKTGAATSPVSEVPPEYGNIVWLCPTFFNDVESPDLAKVPKIREDRLTSTNNRAYILVHEYFHAKTSLSLPIYIRDINGTVPSKSKKVPIYGSKYAADYAWKNTHQQAKKKWRLNPEVAVNADNYAWMFAYNYFYNKFGWKGDGSWDDTNIDLKRDGSDSKSAPEDIGYIIQEEDIQIPSGTATSSPASTSTSSPSGVTPDPTPTDQIIFVYTWLDTKDKYQSWQIVNLPVGHPLNWCDGNLLQDMVGAKNIDGSDVPNPIPFPSSMEFSKIDGVTKPQFKQCSYTGDADKPGTFDCPNFKAPIQCDNTPNVRKQITCPARKTSSTSSVGKSYAVSMAICQWGKSNVK